MTAGGKNPLEAHRIHSRPIRGVGPLKRNKRRDRIQRKLEASLEKAGAVRGGQDPSITNARVPYTRISGPTRNRVSAAGPNLEFVTALLRSLLGRSQGSCQKDC